MNASKVMPNVDFKALATQKVPSMPMQPMPAKPMPTPVQPAPAPKPKPKDALDLEFDSLEAMLGVDDEFSGVKNTREAWDEITKAMDNL